MKKIIFFTLFIFLWVYQVFSDTWTSTVNWINNDWVKNCPNWVVSHWVQHYWVPQTNTSWLPTTWSATCTTHAYTSSSLDYFLSFNTHSQITYCNPWDRIISISPAWCYNYWTCTIRCRKHDDTSPQITDITFPSTNLLAQTNYVYNISVNSWWLAEATTLSWYYERWDNPNLTWAISLTSTNWNFTFNSWNIKDVDNLSTSNRTSSWGRDYTFTITKICDSLWNCSTSPYTKVHTIYANHFNITTKSITTNELDDSWNLSDWTTKNLSINLKDTYWNQILHASWIWRTIDFNFDTSNSMYLNQYIRTWTSSVYTSSANSTDYTNKFPIWDNMATSLNSQISTNWIYNFWFKFYTPTSNQDYTPISDTNSDFYINNITFDVNDPIFSSNNLISINGFSQIRVKASPIYYTEISWDIISEWLIEWVVQSWSIKVTKNGSLVTSNNKLYIEFWSWNLNMYSPKLNLKYWNSLSSVIANILEWNGLYDIPNNFYPKTYYSSVVFPWNNQFYTKLLLQTWAMISGIQDSYISTHIWYNLDWKDIVYNSDVYWKTNYWGSVWSWNTFGSAIKIVWKTYSDKYSEIISGQNWSWVVLLEWSITKSSLKTDVRKKSYELIRNVLPSNWSNTINNFDFSDNEDWRELLNWSLLYFWWLNWNNVTINAWIVTWNKTIIIEWGNAYITWNIWTTIWNNNILGIVVLKDKNWKWWNIYINPNVSFIKSILYADKSLISYDWLNELWGDAEFTSLKNQLYIYWSVFSENTIWWSRSFPIKCPYYVSCTSIEDAQKYDLNYLRRYYLKDTKTSPLCTLWSDGKIDNCDTPAWWWTSYFSSSSPNYKYPIVIEYNTLIQTNPPIIFKK